MRSSVSRSKPVTLPDSSIQQYAAVQVTYNNNVPGNKKTIPEKPKLENKKLVRREYTAVCIGCTFTPLPNKPIQAT